MLEVAAELGRWWIALLEVWRCSGSSPEAQRWLRCAVDVGAEVQRLPGAEQAQEASTAVMQGWSVSLALRRCSREALEERRRSEALGVRRWQTELAGEENCSGGGDNGLQGSKPSTNKLESEVGMHGV